jgi:hypothetical protein
VRRLPCRAAPAPPNPSTRRHLTLVGRRRESRRSGSAVRRRFAAGSSRWCCSVEPPLGKGLTRVACLGARAPRHRPVFAGAPPPRLLVVRPPRLPVAASGCSSWVRARTLYVPVKTPWFRVYPSAARPWRRRSPVLRRRRASPPAAPRRCCRSREIGTVGSSTSGPDRATSLVKAAHTGQPPLSTRFDPQPPDLDPTDQIRAFRFNRALLLKKP